MSTFNYGENLRLVRQAKGISQEAMALQLNISQATYSRIESQVSTKDYAQVFEIAKVLDVPLSDLLPNLAEDDLRAMQSMHGPALRHKTKEVLNTPLGRMIVLGSAAGLVSFSYELVKSLCDDLKAPYYFGVFAPWAVALGMSAYIYYWVRSMKR